MKRRRRSRRAFLQFYIPIEPRAASHGPWSSASWRSPSCTCTPRSTKYTSKKCRLSLRRSPIPRGADRPRRARLPRGVPRVGRAREDEAHQPERAQPDRRRGVRRCGWGKTKTKLTAAANWASRSRRSGSWPSRRRVERATTWRASRRDWSSVKVRARRRDRELAWTRREPRPTVNAGIRRIARFSRRVARPRRLNLILARVIPPLTRPPPPGRAPARLQLRGVPGHAHQRPAHLQRRESFRGERARRRRRRLHRGAPPSPIRSFHPNPNRASPGIHRSSSRVGPVLGDDSQNLKFSL